MKNAIIVKLTVAHFDRSGLYDATVWYSSGAIRSYRADAWNMPTPVVKAYNSALKGEGYIVRNERHGNGVHVRWIEKQ